jgi:hypothetical protein
VGEEPNKASQRKEGHGTQIKLLVPNHSDPPCREVNSGSDLAMCEWSEGDKASPEVRQTKPRAIVHRSSGGC